MGRPTGFVGLGPSVLRSCCCAPLLRAPRFVEPMGSRPVKMGRPTGLEPATPRFTILCSNQLSYDRRKGRKKSRPLPPLSTPRCEFQLWNLFEPNRAAAHGTARFVGWSIAHEIDVGPAALFPAGHAAVQRFIFRAPFRSAGLYL
jgi:hypothetical protein